MAREISHFIGGDVVAGHSGRDAPQEIVLPAVPPLLGPHRITLRQANGGTESRQNVPINLQEIKSNAVALLQMQCLPIRANASKIRRFRILHRRLIKAMKGKME
jgi:hypothetical protein